MELTPIAWDCPCCVAYSTLNIDAMMRSIMLVWDPVCGKTRYANSRFPSQVEKHYVIRSSRD